MRLPDIRSHIYNAYYSILNNDHLKTEIECQLL